MTQLRNDVAPLQKLQAPHGVYFVTGNHEYFVDVVDEAPATGQVRGSNFVRVYARYYERTGRITTVSVEDNLVKGAAGQAVQAFNIVFGLPEPTGLEQLPIVP